MTEPTAVDLAAIVREVLREDAEQPGLDRALTALDALQAQAELQLGKSMTGRLAAAEAERDRLKERVDDVEHRFTDEIERADRLQHIIDCAATPLMRDVMAERDRLREELRLERHYTETNIDSMERLAARAAELEAALETQTEVSRQHEQAAARLEAERDRLREERDEALRSLTTVVKEDAVVAERLADKAKEWERVASESQNRMSEHAFRAERLEHERDQLLEQATQDRATILLREAERDKAKEDRALWHRLVDEIRDDRDRLREEVQDAKYLGWHKLKAERDRLRTLALERADALFACQDERDRLRDQFQAKSNQVQELALERDRLRESARVIAEELDRMNGAYQRVCDEKAARVTELEAAIELHGIDDSSHCQAWASALTEPAQCDHDEQFDCPVCRDPKEWPQLTEPAPCPQCGGRGTESHSWDDSPEACPGCKGTGLTEPAQEKQS